MTFHVGQKVVCVDARPPESGVPLPLVAGAIYTVKSIDTDQDCDGQYGIYLNEVATPPDTRAKRYLYCGGFRPTRFRPITEKKTDISIFTAMLRPEPNAPVKSPNDQRTH